MTVKLAAISDPELKASPRRKNAEKRNNNGREKR